MTLNCSGFLTAFGRKIEYRRFEPPRATSDSHVIILLHEGLGSVAMWKDFPLDLAAATGARVIAYSRFGYGRSDPPAVPYNALEMHRREALEVLPEVLRQLEISHPVLFGHSDGASIALIYAGSVPANVAGVVALAPHLFVEDMCLTSIAGARQTFLASDMRQRLARYHEDPEQAFWLWNDIWLDPSFRDWNIEHAVPTIACPVLAIQGWQDEYGTMAQLDRLAHALSHTEQLRLEACRHSPHRDQPAAVLNATARWVQRRLLPRNRDTPKAPGPSLRSIPHE
jgi:pimeloyl-ACP methyl ester carboxylesterase